MPTNCLAISYLSPLFLEEGKSLTAWLSASYPSGRNGKENCLTISYLHY